MRILTVFLFSLLPSLVIAARAADLPDAPTKAAQLPDAPSTAASASAHDSANEQPDASTPATVVSNRSPVVFPKKISWPIVAACGTAAVFDAQMSHGYGVNHPNATENVDWLFGRKPSLARYYATFAVMDGTAVFLSYRLLHSHHKAARIIGWGIIGSMTAIHTIVMAGK